MAKITIIGTGLIGTSLALALRQSSLRDLTVVGTDDDRQARGGEEKRKAFDRADNRLSSAIEGADTVVLATPVHAMEGLLEIFDPALPAGGGAPARGQLRLTGLGGGGGDGTEGRHRRVVEGGQRASALGDEISDAGHAQRRLYGQADLFRLVGDRR